MHAALRRRFALCARLNRGFEPLEDRRLMAVDLTIAATSAPALAAVQATVSVQWTVANQGDTGTTGVWTDDVYLSTDEAFGAGDVQLTSLAGASPLAAGGSYSRTANVVIPRATVPGNYFLLFRTDRSSQQAEGDEGNNLVARAITISAPDLAVTSLTAQSEAAVQQTIAVQWTTANQGAGEAVAPWSDFVFLSADTTLDAGDVQLTSRSATSPLAAGGEYARSANVSIPRTVVAGDYYLLVHADRNNQQAETNEGNNVALQAITIRSPDLAVSAASAPAAAAVQQTIQVQWTVLNQGDGRAFASWSDSVSLSTDAVLDASDVQLVAQSGQSALVAGGQYSRTANVAIPRATIAGDYYLLFHADRSNQQAESNETNNLAALAISILAPNLAFSSAAAPAAALPGDSFDVSWTVVNEGDGDATAGWTDDIYLSTDAVHSADDVLLAGMNGQSPLASGAEYTQTRTVTLSSGLALGNYFLLIRADRADQQAESDETDNLLALSLHLSPENTPPTALDADLDVAEDGAALIDLRTLAGDAETADDSLAFSVGDAVHGAVELLADGHTARFTPDADFHGAASFTYTVTDGGLLSSPPLTTGPAAIRVTVASVNDAPTAEDDAYTVAQGGVLAVAGGNVLSNDADLEGDSLTAVLVAGPAHGALSLAADGTFIYTPAAGFFGVDSFTYVASDGEDDSLAATVTITVEQAPVGGSVTLEDGVLIIVGTEGDDVVEIKRSARMVTVHASFLPGPEHAVAFKNSSVERIEAALLAGDDTMIVDSGLRRNATIDGGAGNDTLTSGRGDDLLIGGDGDDDLFARFGRDVLVGGDGNDLLRGGDGRDVLIGGDGADELRGMLESDLLIAGFTAYDDDRDALRQIAARWAARVSYAERIASLSNDEESDGLEPLHLTPGVTVFDDGDRDRLFGGNGRDWWFLDPETDKAFEVARNERVAALGAVSE
jgi:subtilase family serine protease